METGSGTGTARHLIWAHEPARRSRTVTVAHQIPTFPASVQACVTVIIGVLFTDWWAKICPGPTCCVTGSISAVRNTYRAPVSAPLRIGEPTTSALPSGTFPSHEKGFAPNSPAMASSGGISDQLFVSVKLESPRLAELDLAPHLFGSHPVAGSWDPCKAVSSGSPLLRVMCARSGFLTRFVFFPPRSCRWSGRLPPCGSSAASCLRSTVSWLV